ncbi:vegetative cell wall protein gp1-like [Miscanthus floridulus]|uniref:vegetative cell wall protein gp1-like n=1 Tax=Miscanthus floridulus TaxID=154761 RepID=UPI00345B1AE5
MSLPLPTSSTPPIVASTSIPLPSTSVPLPLPTTNAMIPSSPMPLGSAGAPAATGGPAVLTPEEVTQAILDLGHAVGEIRAFLGGSNHVQPSPQPQLPPRPPQQQLPPPLPSTAIATSGMAPQYGMPPEVHGSSPRPSVPNPAGGVPIQQIQFPHSPSPLPPWLFAVPPAYSSSTTQPWLPPPPSSAGVGSSYGGAPAPGVLYGGTDGPLFHGSSVPSSHPSVAPAPDAYGGGPAYGGVPNDGGVASNHGGQPPFGASNYGSHGSQPPFGYDP